MTDDSLFRLTRTFDPDELAFLRAGHVRDGWAEGVLRNGKIIPIDPLLELMTDFTARRTTGELKDLDPPATDRWLAPRIHWALRLTRREASDRDTWAYLANYHFPTQYVAWRWGGGDVEKVNDLRWRGPVHKQAFARLWWSAELFRNGSDYSTVEMLLVNQDFPNSYVHRVFARSRPMALGLLDAVATALDGRDPTSNQINDVARRVNLTLGAASIDTATGFHRDDVAAYRAWVDDVPQLGRDWTDLPEGPPDGGVADESLGSASGVGAHICHGAGL